MDTVIDLRSDTVTKPTPAMLDAMFSAKVGDDVFGEDENVNALESKTAELFNMESALFCPSGTMTNQIAIKCFTQPMDEIICDQRSHVYRYEGGGVAYHSLASVRLLNGPNGLLSPEMIEPEINEDNIHYPRTSLVVLENTVNKGGGACYKLEQIEPIHTLCEIKGLNLHLDGARVFNAIVATGDRPANYGRYFNGISVCLSKGLGAPVGSVLLGSKLMIKNARRIRKVFGGGMRQAGFLAAAGLYALNHNIDRLSLDHQHAKVLALALNEVDYVSSIMPVETNIVIFEVAQGFSAADVVRRLSDRGIKSNVTGLNSIRFVTHLDITEGMVDRAIDIIRNL